MQTTNPARYATRLNCDARCVEVYDTQAAIGADDVVASFCFEDDNAGIDARTLADELNYAEAKRAGEQRPEPSDDDSLVVYCERCGNELDPADAVLVNDEMVCCDCNDTRRELIAALQAQADAEDAAAFEREQADADLIAAAGGISANPYRSRIWFDEIQIIERATGRYAAAYSRFDHTAPTCREYWLRELRQRLCEREGLSEYAGPWPCEIRGGMVVRRVRGN